MLPPSDLEGGPAPPQTEVLTVVKGMNCRMLPRLPCSRQSTHSSMNHCTNCVWGPAVREPRMEEMSRNRLAVCGGGEREESHEKSLGRG